MTSKRDAASWRAAMATARGSVHDARGLPNQDSAESLVLTQAGAIVVAVADGHGHGRHFRSGTGSRLAARTACAVAEELAADTAGQPWNAERAGLLRDQIPEAIVTRWREEVARDIAAHPYAPEELSALAAAKDGPEIPYGSTLLVALVGGSWLVCAQIGDGDLLGVRPDGTPLFPVRSDDRLDGYRTTSLCQPEALAAFRAAAHDLATEPLTALLLGTDGYGNAQVKDPWQPSVARDLAEFAARHDHGWFERQLPAWAERCASAGGSGDDTTIALLLAPERVRRRTPPPSAQRSTVQPPTVPPPAARVPLPAAEATQRAVPTAPLPRPSAAAGPDDGPGAGPESRRPARHRASRSRGRMTLAAAAVVVVAGAIAAALVATQSSGSGQDPGRHPTEPAVRVSSPVPSHSGVVPGTPGPAPSVSRTHGSSVSSPTPSGTPGGSTTGSSTKKKGEG